MLHLYKKSLYRTSILDMYFSKSIPVQVASSAKQTIL